MDNSVKTDEIILEDHPEGLKVIRLGQPDEKAVILSERRMDSLRHTLERFHSDRQIKGLLILGPSVHGFCAGADVHVIKSVTDPALGQKLALRGQEVFELIASLPCTTVAAISGACVGGGCELVLACDYRLMLDHPDSKIGLPEVKLGILPGFGGTVRLPRLIGLPRALDIILSGKVLSADRAAKVGLVDQLISASGGDREAGYRSLEATGKELALANSSLAHPALSMRDRFLTYTPWGRRIVRGKAKATVLKETRGHYPAPLRALEVTVTGMGLSREQALREEAKALGELIVTPESKALVHIYFLSERAGKLGKSVKIPAESAAIAVVGGGVMGAGIATAFLLQGFTVTVIEPIEAARTKAAAHIKAQLERKFSRSPSELARHSALLTLTEDLQKVRGSGTVIEAIVEDLITKQEIFNKIREIAGPDVVLASNTSSLSIEELARTLPAPERVIGMHFFNPAEKMPLVEIVRGEKTADAVTLQCAALVAKIGKFPAIVEDVPGFLVNRVLSPYIAEAGTLLMEGVTIDSIDSAATEFGMPMGPFRLLDEVGLDVARKVQEMMQKAYGRRMAAPDFLQKLLLEGRLGRKSGLGFYRHQAESADVDPAVYAILGLPGTSSEQVEKRVIQDRLIMALINESVRCLDERVAGIPGEEAGGQIDLATVMGMGFPPFRGGVIRYAERLGAKALNLRLQGLYKQQGERFAPCEGIVSRAESGRGFYSS